MAPGAYLEDGKKMIGFAAPLIKQGMDDDHVVQSFQYFSNGLEKLLKHGLERINPLFIQKLADFKHSAAVYKDRFVPGYTGTEVEKNPDQDVITFRTSLNRLKVFSTTANNHSQLIHTIVGWRDVLAHRPSSELDTDAIKRMLQKDAYRLVYDFSHEYGEKSDAFLAPHTEALKGLSSELMYEDRIEQHMTALLSTHLQLWESKKGDTAYVAEAEKVTKRELGQVGLDFHNEAVPCPACGQDAIVRLEPQYDHADGEGYLAGVYPDKLTCHYCGLDLRSYEEFDFVNIDGLLAQDY